MGLGYGIWACENRYLDNGIRYSVTGVARRCELSGVGTGYANIVGTLLFEAPL